MTWSYVFRLITNILKCVLLAWLIAAAPTQPFLAPYAPPRCSSPLSGPSIEGSLPAIEGAAKSQWEPQLAWLMGAPVFSVFVLSFFKVTFGVPETDHHLKLAPFHFVDAHDSNGERWAGPRDGELLCDATSRPSENAPCGVNQIFKALLQLLVLLTPSVVRLQIGWVEWQNTSDLVHTGCS